MFAPLVMVRWPLIVSPDFATRPDRSTVAVALPLASGTAPFTERTKAVESKPSSFSASAALAVIPR